MSIIDKKYKLIYETLDKNQVMNLLKKYKDETIDSYNQLLKIVEDNNVSCSISIEDLQEKVSRVENVDYEVMGSVIFRLDNFVKESWISTSGDNSLVSDSNEIKIVQEENHEAILIYLDMEHGNSININTKHFAERDYETSKYEVIFQGEVSENLQVSLILMKYYIDGSVKTDIVNLNKNFIIEDDNFVKISLGLKFINSGIFNFTSIRVLRNEKVIIKGISPKYIKIQDFLKHVQQENHNKNEEITPRYNINMMGVVDEFTYESFKYEVNLKYLSSYNWREEIANMKPDIFFVESAWRGIDNSWVGKIASIYNEISPEIKEIIEWCKSRNIPTVFWNKEGQVNFKRFKSVGALFDYIFITDENILDEQKNICNHDNVYLLPFAAQPKIHNPIDKNKNKLGNVAFAGTWYGYKHPNRIIDMEKILEPALKYDVDIFDRVFDINNASDINGMNSILVDWPIRYCNDIVGQLPYNVIVKTYKNYDVYLNVNTVKNSKYMMARRVYEILACKTPVISSEAISLKEQLEGIVTICGTKEDTKKALDLLLNSPYYLKLQGKLGHRKIMENYTYSKRVEDMLDIIGISYEKSRELKVTMVSFLNTQKGLENIYETFKRQTYCNLDVLVIINNKDLKVGKIKKKLLSLKNIKVISGLGLNLNNIIEVIKNDTNGECIAILDEGCYYGDNYIRDYVNTLSFVDADVIGKSCYYEYIKDQKKIIEINRGGQDTYCNYVNPSTLFIDKNILSLENEKISNENSLQLYLLDQVRKNNLKAYSDDNYNFCIEVESENIDEKNYNVIFFTNDYKTFINV